MLKNYLLVAFRSLLRYRFYSAINITGLAIGIACSILILSFIRHEYSVNRHFSKAREIFRVTAFWKGERSVLTPPAIGPVLRETYPEVVRANRYWGGYVIANVDGNSFRDDMWITDQSFFRMFDFPFIQGDPWNALSRPNSVVVTERLARKYFGSTEAMGRTVKLQTWKGQGYRDYTITGVLRNSPYNSVTCLGENTRAELFIPMMNWGDFLDEEMLESWKGRSLITYVQLGDASQAEALQQKLSLMLDRFCPTDIRPNLAIRLDSLADIYLTDHDRAALKTIQGFLILMFIIVGLASINFINLSTGHSSIRIREIGIRKVLGGTRRQLVLQFMGEAVLLSFVALLLGVGLAELFLEEFNALVGRELALNVADPRTLALFTGLALLVGLLAGCYPALFLSAFNPVPALKGGLKSGRIHLVMRRILVVAQFTIAIFFAIAAHAVSKQLHFVIRQDLGFHQDNVIVIPSVPREWTLEGVRKLEVIKRELMSQPEVLAASVSWDLPGDSRSTTLSAPGWGDHQALSTAIYTVDESYQTLFDLALLEGRFFSQDFFHADTAGSVVLNQTAVKSLGWDTACGNDVSVGGRLCRVVGVVRDFNYAPLRHAIGPLVFRYVYGDTFYRYLSIRLRNADRAEAIGKTWRKVYADAPFGYFYLADYMQDNYTWITRRIRITTVSALLAIFIACLGLIGLTAFMAERRAREIGIRKALGASAANILVLLSKEWTKLVILANLIAWPLVYLYVDHWLQDWAYRIRINIGEFLLPGASALAIALLAVGYQTLKAATADPADTLRTE